MATADLFEDRHHPDAGCGLKRTDLARTINEVSFLTNEPQTGIILIAMTLEITSGAVPSGAASAPAKPD